MADDDALVLTDIADSTATITLNRPEKLNAITPAMLTALIRALETAYDHPAVKVIVLTGAGRAFSAGVDLLSLGNAELVGGAVGDILDLPAHEAIRLLTDGPKVAIAKINGACFTGALEIALACDLQVAANSAKIGDTHAKWGLRPSWGLSQRLVSAVGITRARELSYTARTFTGADAASWNLVTSAVPAEQLDDAVGQLAATVAANSAGSLAAYKDLYRHRLDSGLAEGLEYEAKAAYEIHDTSQRMEAFQK
jgi:enoyl-CoA hydratase/carnithine racemase